MIKISDRTAGVPFLRGWVFLLVHAHVCVLRGQHHITRHDLHQFEKKLILDKSTGRNSSIFTINKYRINTMKIIKIFPINNFCACTKLSLIDNFVILQKRPVEGLLERNQRQNWGFSFENKGRGKT